MTIHLNPMFSRDVIVAIVVLLLLMLTYGSWMLRRKLMPRRWVTILAVTRLVIVLLFALCLVQPTISYTRTAEKKPELLVLVDTSRSMSALAPGGGSRLSAAKEALSGPLYETLSQRYALHLFTFDRAASPIEKRDLDALQPDGPATHVGESLSSALDYHRQMAGQGAPAPERVLVLSDGVDNGTVDPIDVARRHSITVDVLPVEGIASTEEDSSAHVANLQAPRRVLLGSECELQVTLRRDVLERGEVNMKVLADDVPIASRAVHFAEGQEEATVRFTHQPDKAGVANYAFIVPFQGSHADIEASDAASISVHVVDGRYEVLILEEGWRWEFRFLRRVLEDDPSFNFTALLPRGSGFVQFVEPLRRSKLTGFPEGAADLEAFDLLVLGNTNPQRWPRGLDDAIAQAVIEDGKSLIVLAGPNLSRLVQLPAITTLMPVEMPIGAGQPLKGPVDVRPSLDGAASPFFANFLEDMPAYEALPPLDAVYAPVRKRPGATVLLEASQLANSYGNIIVAAEHTVGRGRVLYIGTDTIWKWQMLPEPNENGVSPAELFWQQTLRAMMPPQPSAAGVAIWLQPEHTQYTIGRKVTVHANIQSGQETGGLPDPRDLGQVQATVSTPDGDELPLSFFADSDQTERLQAEFVVSLPGEYVVGATLVIGGKHVAETKVAVTCRPRVTERADAPSDILEMKRIATVTGGNVVDISDAETWPARRSSAMLTVVERRSMDLWQNFVLPVLLCLALGLDWTLRLLRGFV
jgi:hypothetical protein